MTRPGIEPRSSGFIFQHSLGEELSWYLDKRVIIVNEFVCYYVHFRTNTNEKDIKSLMTRPGIEPSSPGPLAKTLPTRPKNRFTYHYPKFDENMTKRSKTWWLLEPSVKKCTITYLDFSSHIYWFVYNFNRNIHECSKLSFLEKFLYCIQKISKPPEGGYWINTLNQQHTSALKHTRNIIL